MYRIKILLILPLLLLLTSCVTVDNGHQKTDLAKASAINVQLGIGYYHRGNLEQANEKLVKAIRQNPKSSQAHHAFAVLQNRFLDPVKAETHFKKAIELDSENSEALNNYGAFLCALDRIDEAEKMFMQAVENPLYRSPEVAYTSAAVCILKQGVTRHSKAKQYLTRALALGSNYRHALINMAEITFAEKNHQLSAIYLTRYHLTGAESARSLWLSIRNEIELGNNAKANEQAEKLASNYAESNEFKQWQALNK